MNKVAGFRPAAGLDWKIEKEDGVVFAGFGVVVVERGDAALLAFLLHVSTHYVCTPCVRRVSSADLRR